MNGKFLRLRLILACALALALSALAPPPRAEAQATTITDNTTVPIDFTATACNGETVNISGDSHVVVHLTQNDNHTTFETHIQFHLSGESASGIKYVANETVDSIQQTPINNGATVFNTVGQLHLIAQGSADNLVVRTTIHTTVNANGQITATSFEFEVECQG
jgi:hypothetical protein